MNKLETYLKEDLEARAFDLFRRGKKIPVFMAVIIGIKSLFPGSLHWFVKSLPGPIGMKIREFYYKINFKSMGENCIIEEGVRIEGMKNISISDYVLIDQNVSLFSRFGYIEIGRRVHVAPYAYISGGGGVFIGDYVGIGAGVRILSHSESSMDGKRMCGPMLPEEMEGQILKAIRIEKDAFLGANAVVMAGITIGEGAVVAANSLVIKNVEPYHIVVGVPAKVMGKRQRVIVPDV